MRSARRERLQGSSSVAAILGPTTITGSRGGPGGSEGEGGKDPQGSGRGPVPPPPPLHAPGGPVSSYLCTACSPAGTAVMFPPGDSG